MPTLRTDAVRRYLVHTFIPDIDPADLSTSYDLVAGGIIDSLTAFVVLAWLTETFDLAAVDGVTPDEVASVEKIEAFIDTHARVRTGRERKETSRWRASASR